MSVLLAQRVNDGPDALSDVVAAYALRAEVLVAARAAVLVAARAAVLVAARAAVLVAARAGLSRAQLEASPRGPTRRQ